MDHFDICLIHEESLGSHFLSDRFGSDTDTDDVPPAFPFKNNGKDSDNPGDKYRGKSKKFIDSDTRSMIDSPLRIRYMHSLNDIDTPNSDNNNDNDIDKDDHHSLSNSNPFSLASYFQIVVLQVHQV